MKSSRIDIMNETPREKQPQQQLTGRMSVRPADDGCYVHLDLKTYGEWLQAILANDVQKLDNLMSEADRETVSDFLRGHFLFPPAPHPSADRDQTAGASLPLGLAVAVDARDMITFLLEKGVSPSLVDCQGKNILHNMVNISHFTEDLVQPIADTYQFLTEALPTDEMCYLLHTEDHRGLRPLESAAQHGLGVLTVAMFNTPGVYLHKVQQHGLIQYKYFDLTDYEGDEKNSRRLKSPLMLMTYVDKEAAMKDSTFLDQTFVKRWHSVKFQISFPIMLLWILVRTAYVVCFFLFDMDVTWFSMMGNMSETMCTNDYSVRISPSTRMGIIIYMSIVSAGMLIIDVIEFAFSFTNLQWPVWNMISGRKSMLIQIYLYRVMSFFLAFSILLCTYMEMDMTNSSALMVMDFMTIMNPLMATICLFYFVQLTPAIGGFIISVHEVFPDLANFMLAFFMMLIPFTTSFYNFMASNSMQGCIAGFDTMWDTFYHVMLSMIDFTGLSLRNIGFLYISHAMYTFVISIALINFLVAVMADTVSKSGSYLYIQTMQRTSTAFTVDIRYRWLLRPVFRFMTRRLLLHEDGKILLVEATVAMQPAEGKDE